MADPSAPRPSAPAPLQKLTLDVEDGVLWDADGNAVDSLSGDVAVYLASEVDQVIHEEVIAKSAAQVRVRELEATVTTLTAERDEAQADRDRAYEMRDAIRDVLDSERELWRLASAARAAGVSPPDLGDPDLVTLARVEGHGDGQRHTVEDIARFVEHLRDGYQSTTEPVKKVARLIRERFAVRAAGVSPPQSLLQLRQNIERLHCYQDGGQYFIDGFEDCRKQVLAAVDDYNDAVRAEARLREKE